MVKAWLKSESLRALSLLYFIFLLNYAIIKASLTPGVFIIIIFFLIRAFLDFIHVDNPVLKIAITI